MIDQARALAQQLRTFEVDHHPDGWPAIRMRDVSRLLDTIDALCAEVERLTAEIKESHEQSVQEPAGHFLDFTYADSVGQVYAYDQFTKGQPFYTTPPAAQPASAQEPVSAVSGQMFGSAR